MRRSTSQVIESIFNIVDCLPKKGNTKDCNISAPNLDLLLQSYVNSSEYPIDVKRVQDFVEEIRPYVEAWQEGFPEREEIRAQNAPLLHRATLLNAAYGILLGLAAGAGIDYFASRSVDPYFVLGVGLLSGAASAGLELLFHRHATEKGYVEKKSSPQFKQYLVYSRDNALANLDMAYS